MAATKRTTNEAQHVANQPDATLQFADSRHLRQFVDLALSVTKELKIRVEGDGLHAKAVDPAHVLMGTFHVGPAGLTAYDVQAPGETGVDLEKLEAAGKSFGYGDPAALQLNGDVTAAQGRVERSHPHLDTQGMMDPKVPDLDLPGEATIPDVGELEKFVRYAGKETAEHVRVTVCPTEGLTVEAVGEEGGSTDTYHAPLDEIAPNHGLKESVSSLFSVDYLTRILKAAKAAETGTEGTTRLFVGTDYPLRARVNNGIVEARFLLAPRIE